MPLIAPNEDAFGQALLGHLDGVDPQPLWLDVDDGQTSPAMPPAWFFHGPDTWDAWEQSALASLSGRVLDLGAGAGRASLYLQGRGLVVTAVDVSPGAVEVCRRRGIADARQLDFVAALPEGPWNAVLMLCGNLGLGGSFAECRALLTRLHEVCAPGALLIGDTVDPTLFEGDAARAYQSRVVAQGGYVGDIRLRLRYGECVSPWWSQCNIAIADVPRLVDGTGWQLEQHQVNGIDHYVRLRRDSRA